MGSYRIGPWLLRLASFAVVLAAFAAGAWGQVITEFPVISSGTDLGGIVAGPDGNLWFTEFTASKIGRITTEGVVTEFPLPTASNPQLIAAGADGNLWFPEATGDKIGRITTAGVITEFPVLTTNAGLTGIAAGPDGNLWFIEGGANKVGRITTAGVVTEFPVPTAGVPLHIAAGPDGNLWFTEYTANKIGRITTTGVITEFPILTAGGEPQRIAAGPDGNLWFTETHANKIGRITTSGVVTEFPIPTAGTDAIGIAAGADGNLWFTKYSTNQVSRITTAGVVTEFTVPTAASIPTTITPGPDGSLWFCEGDTDKIGRITTGPAIPRPMEVDARLVAGANSDANGVLESGETVQVAPAWENTLVAGQAFTGGASGLAGPGGGAYTINDGTADYGTVGAGATGNCNGQSGDCYLMTITGSRPAAHWDATFNETLTSNGIVKVWTLHVGDSFPDVPRSHPFYRYVETLFHSGVTGGCGGGNFCPGGSVTRAQMAVFLLKSMLGPNNVPPAATGTVFGDVHLGDFAADWIEELAGFQITGGCGNGNYCPGDPVRRKQMAVFLLKAEHGSGYTPPGCMGLFGDVPCPSQFADWIEQFAAEGVTGGCGNGNYCPDSVNIRGQMAVFLVKAFGLELYGP